MAGENSPSRSRPRQAGFIGSLVALASALADFFESRAALFATESKAALVQFVLWTALAAAGLHILIALIFLLVARSGIKRPIFRATTAELKKDREWLKNLETTNQTRS